MPGQPRRTGRLGSAGTFSARRHPPAPSTVSRVGPTPPAPSVHATLKTRQCASPRKRSIGVMARVNTPSQPMTELYLIQGEVPDTRDLDDARQWVTIYRELVTFADRTLSRLRREKGGNIQDDRPSTPA